MVDCIGITVEYLHEFVAPHSQMWRQSELKTREVVTKIIEVTTTTRTTKGTTEGTSYCHFMSQDKKKKGVAKIFISHSWDSIFMDVYDALTRYFEDNSIDTVTCIWFDIFSSNQHCYAPLGTPELLNRFETVISSKKMETMISVVSPFDAIPFNSFHRSWCLYEIYGAIKHNKAFVVAMTETDWNKFLEELDDDVFETLDRMQAQIDCRNCAASKEEDRKVIDDIVEGEIGFEQVNTVVFDCCSKWILNQVEKEWNKEGNLRNTRILALVYAYRGEYHKALELLGYQLRLKNDVCTVDDLIANLRLNYCYALVTKYSRMRGNSCFDIMSAFHIVAVWRKYYRFIKRFIKKLFRNDGCEENTEIDLFKSIIEGIDGLNNNNNNNNNSSNILHNSGNTGNTVSSDNEKLLKALENATKYELAHSTRDTKGLKESMEGFKLRGEKPIYYLQARSYLAKLTYEDDHKSAVIGLHASGDSVSIDMIAGCIETLTNEYGKNHIATIIAKRRFMDMKNDKLLTITDVEFKKYFGSHFLQRMTLLVNVKSPFPEDLLIALDRIYLQHVLPQIINDELVKDLYTFHYTVLFYSWGRWTRVHPLLVQYIGRDCAKFAQSSAQLLYRVQLFCTPIAGITIPIFFIILFFVCLQYNFMHIQSRDVIAGLIILFLAIEVSIIVSWFPHLIKCICCSCCYGNIKRKSLDAFSAVLLYSSIILVVVLSVI